MPCGRVFDNSSGLWLSLVSPLQERNKLQIKYRHNIDCFFKRFNLTDQSVLAKKYSFGGTIYQNTDAIIAGHQPFD